MENEKEKQRAWYWLRGKWAGLFFTLKKKKLIKHGKSGRCGWEWRFREKSYSNDISRLNDVGMKISLNEFFKLFFMIFIVLFMVFIMFI